MTTWPDLHAQARYRPRYPEVHVVRWLASLPSAGGLALDIGAGAGRHTKLLSEFGYTTVATDLSAEGLRHMRPPLLPISIEPGKFMEVPVGARVVWFDGTVLPDCVQAHMERLPFRDATFDVALAYASLYYGDPKWGIQEMARILKPGGHGFMTLRTLDDHAPSRGEGMSVVLEDEGIFPIFIAPYFSGYTYERVDTTRNGRTELDSEWLISVVK